MKKDPLYAQVVFSLPLAKSFDYAVPQALKEKVALGERVRVPFGEKSKIGYIVGLSK